MLGLPYLHAGTGHPVVLLHGWAAFKEIWWGTLQALAPRYYGIALEWPGHGSSPASAGAQHLADLAALAAQSCQLLGLERVTVVGHSMGGRVAALLALLQPQLVARLVLVDAALDPKHIAPYARSMLQPQVIKRSITMSRWFGHGLGRLLRPSENGHQGGLIRPALRRARYNALADAQSLHHYVSSLYQESLEERLPEITQPTLVISGARDLLVLPRQAREAARLIPNAQLELIPRAFHNPMDDRPAEFHRVLLRFLDTAAICEASLI